MKKRLCIFDVEVLPNCFIVCVRIVGGETRVFEISARKFELPELYKFFTSEEYIFVGYNCIHYDTPLVNMLIGNYWSFNRDSNYLIVSEACQKLSNQIIDGEPREWSKWKYAKNFSQIDLMTMMASQGLRVSLKAIQVNMCFPNVQEMNIKWGTNIMRDKIDELISYCHNDTESTLELLKLLKGDIQLRRAIQEEFGINCLSKDGVGIGVDIFTRYICEELELDSERDLYRLRDNLDVIPVCELLLPEIKFKTKPFQKILDTYKNLVLNDEGLTKEPEWSVTAICNNLAHTFGLGGLHSVNRPKIFQEDDEHWIIDADVGSMYPSMALAWGFGPKGFSQAFLNVMVRLKTERMIAKRAGNSVKDKVMKLALNSILGNLRNKYSPYYAPEANTAICVNGQLFLAMLIEDLELAGIEVIMSNTDGITAKIHKSKVIQYYMICDKWQQLSKIELEYVDYEKMAIYKVNDYVAYKKGFNKIKDQIEFPGAPDTIEYNYSYVKKDPRSDLIDKYVKQKGLFISYTRLGKGLDALIIAKALQNYYGKGIPVEETIRKADSIWDFISFQKIGKQYTVVWNDQEQQHINRFYVSKKGAFLYKVKDKEGKKAPSNVLKGFGVQLFNKYEKLPMEKYNIDYSYYISRARETVYALEPIQQSLF